MKTRFTILLTAAALGASVIGFTAEPLPPLRVSDDGRCFVKADGTPFFWLGDTAWSIFNHPKPEDVDLYLDDRAAKGFNVIQGCLVLWDGLRRPNYEGQLPFVDGDPGQVNQSFFLNVDAIIDKAAMRGLHLAILPCWVKTFMQNRPRYEKTLLNPDLMKSYCKFLGQRYGKKNVVWVLGGDWPGKELIGLSEAMAAGLIEGAGTDQILITYHPTGRQSSSFWFHNSPWLDFNAIQSGHFIRTTNFRLVADDYAKKPAKPTLDMEPAYENITDGLVRNDPKARRISADDVRRSAYLAVFAGAAGHTYGCGEVYEFWSPESRGGLPGWAAGLSWRESLKLPGSSQLRFLRSLIESRPMRGRIPDQSLVVGDDLPVLDRVQATRATDGSYVLVYTAAGKPFRLQLETRANTELVAWWYDPRTGEAQQFDRFTSAAPRNFTPPARGVGKDWVLVLDDAAKSFPAPGTVPERTSPSTQANRFRFSFGTDQPASGFTGVAATNLYHQAASFGFESGAKIMTVGRCVASDKPFLFSVKLPEGNYAVILTLGDEAGESSTTVKAEARRLMLENVRTAKGEIVTREFTVNLRTPRIGDGGVVRLKQREKDSEQVTWDDRLTLEFNGVRPCLRTLEITPAPDVPTVFVAGDSTVCDQPVEPWNSWGQMLPRFFKPGVAVANYAQSGESIRSSMSARRFEKIFSLLKPGDWLLVQFGHNDMKDRTPDALDTYRTNLKRIVVQTRAKGGTPVLITSMERKAGVYAPTLAVYPDAVRAVGREDNVALVDLHAMSVRLYQALATNLSQAFQDGTHHNNYGSYELAKCVAAGMAAAKLEVAKFLVEDVKTFDPSDPDPLETFTVPPSLMRSADKPEGN